MEEIHGHVVRVGNRTSGITIAQAMALGFMGGLAGTLVMDLALAGLFSATGMPTDLTFSFIGDTAATFFSKVGILVSGGIPLGMVCTLSNRPGAWGHLWRSRLSD